MARAWGYWTRGKLDVLREYLTAFTTATNRSRERIYIDAFAGEADNRDRLTGEPIAGSARIALSTDAPPFTRLRFFEVPGKAPQLSAVLRSDYPDREFQVVGGDCNEEIPRVLNELKPLAWAPTFAFIDPNGMEAQWRTLAALAGFRAHQKTKVELFLLFAAPMFGRLLRVDGASVREEDESAIDEMYGCGDWRGVYRARLAGRISPSLARDEYINLMRWRLENQLGYRWTHPLEIRNEGASPIYYMIFATDHKAGTRIMSSLYAKAAAEFPAMRAETRRERRRRDETESGVQSLFGPDDDALWAPIQRGERFYEHEPPRAPRW